MDGMSAIEIVYLICFFLGLGFAILSGLLSGVFSGGGEAHVDAGGHDAGGGHAGHAGDMHFSPLSPVVIAMFITAFGGTGIILKKMTTWGTIAHLPLSAVSGVAVAALVFYIFWKVFSTTQSSSEVVLDDVVGIEGEVITVIPANGIGEISYVAKQQRFTGPARAVDNRDIPARSIVRIIKIVSNTFYVERTS